MANISIEEIITALRLVKKDTCQDYATTAALAKMLGARKMDVLLFIEQNPKLLHTEERYRKKSIQRTIMICGRPVKESHLINGASLGLCLIEAFPDAKSNPWNPEWLEATKRHLAKTLWLSEVNNYGEILGHCFHEDERPSDIPSDHLFADNRRNDWLWRNTREKLEEAKSLGGCFEHSYIMGGYGDSYERKEPYAVNAQSLQLLKNAGWTIIV